MTEIPSIVENWLEEESPTHRKLKAVKNLTRGCPCDRCVSRNTCRVTHHECKEFKTWANTGSTTGEKK